MLIAMRYSYGGNRISVGAMETSDEHQINNVKSGGGTSMRMVMP